jgi:integrase
VAVAASPSNLVFPDENGKPRDPETKLDRVLRRALGRAGIVTGWKHICRRAKCRLVVEAGDPNQRDCPNCGMKLWLKPVPRHVRFHDLRHTTATLLLKAGVPIATVQRILRHTDPALTSEIYGHLDVEDMRVGVNRLAFASIESQHVIIDITPTGERVIHAGFATRLLPDKTEP